MGVNWDREGWPSHMDPTINDLRAKLAAAEARAERLDVFLGEIRQHSVASIESNATSGWLSSAWLIERIDAARAEGGE